MATAGAYLTVVSVAPEKDPAKRVLSPLFEDEDEPLEDDRKGRVFELTEDPFLAAQAEYIKSKQDDFKLKQDDLLLSSKRAGSEDSETNTEKDAGDDEIDGLRTQSDEDEIFDEIFSDSGESSINENDEDYDTDLEIDEDKLLHPEKFDRDLTGKSKYIKVCEEMGISPTTYFIKHITDRELKLQFHGLGPLRMKAIAIPLETNTNIEVLNLEGNAIDSEGAICLTKVLKENFFITELVLGDNRLGTDGCAAISKMLVHNRNIVKLDLTANEISDGAAQSFYDVLVNNKVLKVLLLARNCFEDEGARLFKSAMSMNTTLEVLDLSWNHFKTKGAILLAELIEDNYGLRSFNMAMAGLGKDGAKALAKALKENRSLLELDISLNRIPIEGAIDIATGLRVNDTLQVLKAGSNPYDSEGAMVLLEAVAENDSSELVELDFSHIMVKMKFAKLQFRLQEERDIRIVSEGIIPEVPRTHSARLTAFRVDPIATFKMYADNAGVNLNELLSVGLDHSMPVKDFKDVLKNSEIDISEDQIGVIARKLTQNGRVYFRCLLDISSDDEYEDSIPDGPSTERGEATLTFSPGRSKITPEGRSALK